MTAQGTGGALTGSMLTTVCGLGVLYIAVIPLIAEFGLLLALGVLYAYLASILVLPATVVVWHYLETDLLAGIGDYMKNRRPASVGGCSRRVAEVDRSTGRPLIEDIEVVQHEAGEAGPDEEVNVLDKDVTAEPVENPYKG